MKKVLVVGEINVDLILRGYHSFPMPGKEVLVDEFVMTLGSASAICAMGLAALGNSVAFLGRVGVDPWGDYCLKTMEERGIDVSRVIRDPVLKTGVTISITSAQDRALVSFLGTIRALTGGDVSNQAFEGFDHLHISSYFLQEGLRPSCGDVFGRAKRLGLTTSLDPGFDPREEWGPDLRETLKVVDVFLPNEVELAGLSGSQDPVDGLKRLANGQTKVVAKLGSRGAMVLEGDTVVHEPTFPVQVVDTTGAGDSFDAGFLHGFLRGFSLRECLVWGVASGALSIRALGGTTSQADAAEVEDLIRARH
jgi:sugar/nucleoside kinase (ribokinase family)